MRFLIFFKSALLRHFESTLVQLADEGHELIFATPHEELLAKIPRDLIGRPNISVVSFPLGRGDHLQAPISLARYARDYLRYLDPKLEVAWANRERSWQDFVAIASGRSREAAVPSPPWFQLTETEKRNANEFFETLERLMPPDPKTYEFIERHRPDAVLVTPLVTRGSLQADIVAAARYLGIPSGLLVFSWDNLSNKGIMHVRPDRVFVWNELQADEAVDLHGVPRSHVVITGAPRFDDFFAMAPESDRDSFMRSRGLDPERRLVLYLGSAPFVSQHESGFAGLWLDAIRSSSREASEAAVLIRPHPRNRGSWEGWRPEGENVVLELAGTLQSLYDQIHHSDAVVGLNTSGQIEAAILGKPVYTIGAGDVAPGQEGSSHFYYLLRENGGFVEHGGTMDEHVEQLARGLRGEYDRNVIRGFVESFVRPKGLENPATPFLAAAMVSFARDGKQQTTNDPGLTEARVAATPDPGASVDIVDPATLRTADGTAVTDNILQVDYPNEKIYIHASSKMERKWRVEFCKKEPWTVVWLERHIKPGDVVYDIGSNVGVVTMIAAKLLGDTGSVVSFEPGAANYGRLCENLALNGLSDMVIPLPLLLSRATHLQTFIYRSLDPGQSRHRVRTEKWSAGAVRVKSGRYAQPILGIKLDDAVKMFDLPHPTLVKLDVDGGEVDVLNGARKVFKNRHVRSMLVEVDQELSDDVVRLGSKLGFRLNARHAAHEASRVWYAEFDRE